MLGSKVDMRWEKSSLVIIILSKLIWEMDEKTMIEKRSHSLRLIIVTFFSRASINWEKKEIYQQKKRKLTSERINIRTLKKLELLTIIIEILLRWEIMIIVRKKEKLLEMVVLPERQVLIL